MTSFCAFVKYKKALRGPVQAISYLSPLRISLQQNWTKHLVQKYPNSFPQKGKGPPLISRFAVGDLSARIATPSMNQKNLKDAR